MTDTHFLGEVLLFLGIAVGTVALFRRLNVSPVIGYLVAGMAIGPDGLGLIRDPARLAGLAELGVVFLLFSVGLELTFHRLRAMGWGLLGLGVAQVMFCGFALGLVGWMVGLRPGTAVMVGGALALSSTAIVLQLLAERGEIMGRAGRVAVAILLVQDLAVVPLLVLVPLLGGAETALAEALGLALGRAVLALAAIILIGRLVIRPLFHAIASRRTPELLVGLSLLVVLGASFATEAMGLSLALGAFLAGLLVAETEFRHQVEADLQPFRGLLLSLFFVTVGMNVDFGLIVTEGTRLAAVVGGILAIKLAVIFGTALLFRLPAPLALRQGILLAECGEFALILFAPAMALGLIDGETGQLLMLAVAVTMVLTPLLGAIGRFVEGRLEADGGGVGHLEAETRDLTDHVLVLGFGRVGEALAELLTAPGIPYVALDLNPARVAEARGRGLPVYYGDGSRRDVLRAAGAERARLVAITMNDAAAAARTVAILRARFPDMPIFVRARDAAHCRELSRMGATGIVPELVEVSFQLGAQVLKGAGLAEDDVALALETVRSGAAGSGEDMEGKDRAAE